MEIENTILDVIDKEFSSVLYEFAMQTGVSNAVFEFFHQTHKMNVAHFSSETFKKQLDQDLFIEDTGVLTRDERNLAINIMVVFISRLAPILHFNHNIDLNDLTRTTLKNVYAFYEPTKWGEAVSDKSSTATTAMTLYDTYMIISLYTKNSSITKIRQAVTQ